MATREEVEAAIDEWKHIEFVRDELKRIVKQGVQDCHELRDEIWYASRDHYMELAECLVDLSQFDREVAIESIADILPFIEQSSFVRGCVAPTNTTD